MIDYYHGEFFSLIMDVTQFCHPLFLCDFTHIGGYSRTWLDSWEAFVHIHVLKWSRQLFVFS